MKKMLFLCVACIVFLNVVAQKVFLGQQVPLGKLKFQTRNGKEVIVKYNNGTFEVSADDWNKIQNLQNKEFYTKAGSKDNRIYWDDETYFPIKKLTIKFYEL